MNGDNFSSNLFIRVLFLLFFVSILTRVQAQSWYEKIKIISEDRQAWEYFGTSIDSDGDWAVIGASADSHDSLGQDSIYGCGSAFIYHRENGDWKFHQKINSSNREFVERFGTSVSIDGDLILVGSVNNRTNENGLDSISGAGAVFVFRKESNNAWVQETKLVASDRMSNDFFGSSIDFDKNWAIIGVPKKKGDTIGGKTGVNAGSVYLFERRIHGIWIEKQKITASDFDDYSQFGSSVGIHNEYAVIGAKTQSTDENSNNYLAASGAAYILKRDSNNFWNEVQKIVAKDRSSLAQFGLQVSIHDETVIVGSYLERFDELGSSPLDTSGAVYVFRIMSNKWDQSQKIVPPDRSLLDHFGWSVDIKYDLLAIGAIFESEDSSGGNSVASSGSVYLYKRATNQWQFYEKVKANDAVVGGWYGYSLSLCDTNTVFIGSNNSFDKNGENYLENSGSAYIISNSKIVGVRSETNVEFTIDAYPNPTSGELIIDFPSIQRDVQIKQIDITGKILQEIKNSRTKSIKLELNGNKGIYILLINTGDEIHTLKIIKK